MTLPRSAYTRWRRKPHRNVQAGITENAALLPKNRHGKAETRGPNSQDSNTDCPGRRRGIVISETGSEMDCVETVSRRSVETSDRKKVRVKAREFYKAGGDDVRVLETNEALNKARTVR